MEATAVKNEFCPVLPGLKWVLLVLPNRDLNRLWVKLANPGNLVSVRFRQ